MASATETAVGQKRHQMKQLEAHYLRTKEYLKSNDWQAKRDQVLMRLSSTLATYPPRQGQDATAAAFVLGQAKQIILEVQEVTDVIVVYEALKAELERYDERAV